MLRTSSASDTITVTDTGDDTATFISSGDGDDEITVENTGDRSILHASAGNGNDSLNLYQTGADSLTELGGGEGDDTFTLGFTFNTLNLNGLRGTICVVGDSQDGSAGMNDPLVVCGMDRTLARGDLLVFNDQNGPAGSTYTLTESSLARTGVAATVTYAGTETVNLRTNTFSTDFINVASTVSGGTTFINSLSGEDVITIASTGAGSNLQVNGSGLSDTITLQSSGSDSAVQINGQAVDDVINVWATGPGSLTELNGGGGEDTFILGSPSNTLEELQGTICVFGGEHVARPGSNPPLIVCGVDRTLLRGDLIVINDSAGAAGGRYTLTDDTVARTGAVTIAFGTIETVVLNTTNASGDIVNVTNTVPGGTTIINSGAGDDTITVVTTGAGSVLQVNAGSGGDTIFLQNSGASSAVELNGDGGNDAIDVFAAGNACSTELNGGDGDDALGSSAGGSQRIARHALHLWRGPGWLGGVESAAGCLWRRRPVERLGRDTLPDG